MTASVHSGRLWTAHHFGVNSDGTPSGASGGRAAVRWYEIADLSTTPSVRQKGTIFDNAASKWSLRVAKLLAPPPIFTPTPTMVTAGSTTNITLNATSTAICEGFFDPGRVFRNVCAR